MLLALIGPANFVQAQPAMAPTNGTTTALSDVTILIIRHAEKPDSGFELSPTGTNRAEAYAKYFKGFTLDSRPSTPDYLFATADSAGSHRPRLTLEPLSKALGLRIDNRFKNKDFNSLVQDIRSKYHGKCILIAWHHGEIPALATALGADAAKLLPSGAWPTQTFNWVLELRYDHAGHLMPAETKRINENLMPGDEKN